MSIFQSISQIAGNTPTVRLNRLEAFYSCRAQLYAKCEFLNPSGSIKDRSAISIIKRAAACGELSEEGTVICLSGGNGGISAAMICASLGIRCTVIATDNIALSDMRHIRAFGADLVLTPASRGLEGMKRRADSLARELPGSFVLNQFEDGGNPLAHKCGTGPEILSDLPDIDALVCGIGTGGTVTGCAEYLKMHRPDCLIVGVEPYDSPVLSGGLPGSHSLTGIGVGFVPDLLNTYILDKVIRVRTPDALSVLSNLAKLEGMLCGPSSGAAAAAAIFLAQQEDMEGKKIALILPDRGESYLERDIYGK